MRLHPHRSRVSRMAGLRFSVRSLGMVRFAISPIWETIAAIRLLHHPGRGLLGEWTAEQLPVLDQLPWLRALVPPSGHMADVLTPTPPRARNSLRAELEVVAQSGPEVFVADLRHVLANRHCLDRSLIERALADPVSALIEITAEVERAHRMLIEPLWPRLRGVAEADIAHRVSRVGDRGALAMLADLHPGVVPTDAGLTVSTSCPEDTELSDGDGLVLVPCAFAWPEVLLMRQTAGAPTLAYAPRGIAGLWTDRQRARAGLAELIGRTRAQILTLLELPMTTGQLAGSLGIAAPSVSPQVAVLRDNGLVTSTRRGRVIVHERTGRGDGLIGGV